jgi:hypothetical protein
MGILSGTSHSPQFRRDIPHVPFGRSLIVQAKKAPQSYLEAHRDDRFTTRGEKEPKLFAS